MNNLSLMNVYLRKSFEVRIIFILFAKKLGESYSFLLLRSLESHTSLDLHEGLKSHILFYLKLNSFVSTRKLGKSYSFLFAEKFGTSYIFSLAKKLGKPYTFSLATLLEELFSFLFSKKLGNSNSFSFAKKLREPCEAA